MITNRDKHIQVVVVTCLILLALTCSLAEASIIIMPGWRVLVPNADFVGIVQCTVAGGVVAQYKVLEVWKGKVPDRDIRIRFAVYDGGGPFFPIVLRGDVLLVIAKKVPENSQYLFSLSTVEREPLWWRQVPADFVLPLRTGVIRAPGSATRFFDSECKDLSAFREACRKLVGMYYDRILGWMVIDYIAANQSSTKLGARTFDFPIVPLSPPKDKDPSNFSTFRFFTEYNPEIAVNYLLDWRYPVDDEYKEKYSSLYIGNMHMYYRAHSYLLASYFAVFSTGDRIANLTRILESARQPFVRVAAATSLAFEDEKRGLEALRRFTTFEGDAGAWAALTLVRRGEKQFIPRLLRVLSTPGGGTSNGVLTNTLKKRLLVLMSNSYPASASGMLKLKPHIGVEGVVTPSTIPAQDWCNYWYKRYVITTPEKALEANLAWWNENKDDFVPHDPWLGELIAQKVD